MNLFTIKNNSLEEVERKPFKLEKDIQQLVENNTETLFQLEFICTELSVDKYRLDSLCFDTENNSFVIIEYKKGNSYSVIDQGYTYLQLLLNNKSDFLLTLSQHYNKVLRLEDVDWSQSRIIFISPSFNSYQKDSVNFKNLPFELWEIKRYSNNTVVFDKHKSTSTESIDSISSPKSSIISQVSNEVKVHTIDEHTSRMSDSLNKKWEELIERFNEFEGVELIPKRHYVGLNLNGTNICYIKFRKSTIIFEIVRGSKSEDGVVSKNFFDLDDPKELSEEKSRELNSGRFQYTYVIKTTDKLDVDYMMFLMKQKYNNLL
jgi:predicted transport protein